MVYGNFTHLRAVLQGFGLCHRVQCRAASTEAVVELNEVKRGVRGDARGEHDHGEKRAQPGLLGSLGHRPRKGVAFGIESVESGHEFSEDAHGSRGNGSLQRSTRNDHGDPVAEAEAAEAECACVSGATVRGGVCDSSQSKFVKNKCHASDKFFGCTCFQSGILVKSLLDFFIHPRIIRVTCSDSASARAWTPRRRRAAAAKTRARLRKRTWTTTGTISSPT